MFFLNNRMIISLTLLLVYSGILNAGDLEMERELRSISNEINKSLPLQIDREKMLEVTVAIHDTLLFKYKFTDETVINSVHFSQEKYLEYLRNSLGQSMCTDRGTVELLRRGAKYEYLFINKRGLQVINYTLDAKACATHMLRNGLGE